MNYIDFEISEVIKDLPDVINKASVEIIASRRKSNFNDFGFAAGLSLGKLLQVLWNKGINHIYYPYLKSSIRPTPRNHPYIMSAKK